MGQFVPKWKKNLIRKGFSEERAVKITKTFDVQNEYYAGKNTRLQIQSSLDAREKIKSSISRLHVKGPVFSLS